MRNRLHPIMARVSLPLLFVALAACGSEDDPGGGGGGTEPPPPGSDLSIRFSVHQLGDTERLLWKGSAEGPDTDSPQRTARPLVPAAEPFRVDWELVDSSVPIIGFQYRVTQDSREGDLRMPRDGDDLPFWGSEQSFTFANSTPREFITTRCVTGGDCPEVLLLSSSELHSISVYARTSNDQETSIDEALLEFEIVNEAPDTELVVDGSYPYWYLEGETPQVLAANDTIPAGAKVVFKLQGTDPDPVVLKMPLPRVRYQGLYRFEDRSGPTRELSTFYSTPSEADTIEFAVGPFRYTFFGRAVDRLRAVDQSPVSFQFDAGFAPRIESVSPGNTDMVLLRDPANGTWPQNTVNYELSPPDEKRLWFNGRFNAPETINGEEWTGRAFRIPLEVTAQSDPRESASPSYGNARSFAYEWVSENDPDNSIRDRGRFDDLALFDNATAPGLYRLDGEIGIEIFVPNLFWLQPELFEEGTCTSTPGADFCGVGDFLRRQLGQIAVGALGRHTATTQSLEYYSGTVDGDGTVLRAEIGEWGMVSATFPSSFPVHLGLDDGAGGVEYWPPQTP